MGEFISRRAECERRTAQLQKVALQRAIKHIEAQAKINTRKKSGATARTITSKVTGEGQNLQAIVGGNDDNLIYEEFGTGIYSEKMAEKHRGSTRIKPQVNGTLHAVKKEHGPCVKLERVQKAK